MKKKTIRNVVIIAGITLAVVLLNPLLLSRCWLGASKIDVQRAVAVGWIPPRTNDVEVSGSLLQFHAEFLIREAELRAWCQEKKYPLSPIVDAVLVKEAGQGGQSSHVKNGLVHDRLSHRGGYRLVWDRAKERAYVTYAHN